MKKVILDFHFFQELANVPDYVEENIKFYQEKFLEWLTDPSNKHQYWFYPDPVENDFADDDNEPSLSYAGEAFVYWLNEFILTDSVEKASLEEGEYTGKTIYKIIHF